VTVCCEVILAGAVYNPLALIVPVPGFTDQVTAVLLVFTTAAVNCVVCPPYNVAVVGVTLTDTGGASVTVAEADFVVSSWLVAVTVTICWATMLAGAV
jgi:hypothetical protein